jgi:hypothetical protein
MANIDPRFITTSDVDTYFVDNSSGLPMSGGILTFYSDVNRTVLKPVYQLTGQPGNYTYAPLNNPITLSSSGTVQDQLGNNIVIYYYPFEGTPQQNTGEQELYYITCVNSGFVPQFTRQGWPQAAGIGVTPVSDYEIENYIPNGQFLAHNDPVDPTEPPIMQWEFPSETVDGQAIAQGGWYFAYTDGTTATFDNSFQEIPLSGGWGINSFPRWVFNFVCTGIGDVPKTRDLRIIWPDVNKFSSGNPPGSIPYTLFFDSRSNDMNTYNFTLYMIYYYGTGGTPSDAYTSTPIATISVGPSLTFVSSNIQGITFPPNLGTIGENGDDYVALTLRGPTSGWNVAFTDFALVQGNQQLTSFPVQTNDEMLSRGVAGFMPTPDPMGFDMYLPLVLTPEGMTFDHSIVGQIISKTQLAANAVNNELFMDGSTYIASEYSTIGIPYQRLANYLMLNCTAISVSNGSTTSTLPAGYMPGFGTGPNFVSIFVNATSGKFDLGMNTASGSNSVSNGTSGFTNVASDPLYIFTVPAVPTAGQYFSFTVATGGPLTYNVWFTVNDVGTAPAEPTGANIEVDLVTADTVASTILKIAKAINGYQFALLDLRGYFLRGLDPSATTDPDAASRVVEGIYDGNGTAWTGAFLGSLETGAFASHTHVIQQSSSTGGQTHPLGGLNSSGAATLTNATGGRETRPINIAVNFFIKY